MRSVPAAAFCRCPPRHFDRRLARAAHSHRRLAAAFDSPLPPLEPRAIHACRDAVGLFGFQGLHAPAALAAAAAAAIAAASEIAAAVSSAAAPADLARSVKRLDALSDILCAVVDTAELVRNVHPHPAFVSAADDAHAAISSFLNQLNTNQGLYSALRRSLALPDASTNMSPQERRVALLLISDFEKSGIHMPDATRRTFVLLNDRILALGQQFTIRAAPAIDAVRFNDPYTELQGLPIPLIDALCRSSPSSSSSSHAFIHTSSDSASIALRCAHNQDTRRRLFVAMNSGSPHQLGLLEDMLIARAQLASLLNKQSYSHLTLVDKMAETPETVWSFLDTLAQANRPLADAECARLQSIKRVHTGRSDPIQAWDRLYYSQFLSSQPPFSGINAKDAPPSVAAAAADPLHNLRHTAAVVGGRRNDALASYFSVGATFEGLSMVFDALYGIQLEPAEMDPGEAWHPDVRKLHVVSETEGKLGTIYCDLFQREPGGGRKYENAAHFTVRCSRRIDDDHLVGIDPSDSSSALAGLANGVMRNPQNERTVVVGPDGTIQPGAIPGISPNQQTRRYQLPIVVLVTSFPRPQPGKPGLLSLQDIDTLFHEMGHAMHSMLARTDYQHIAGTRVAMDFVEVPSILMEYFARSPTVLAAFGRHYETGEPVPLDLLWTLRSSHTSFEALETQRQLQMAMLDQLYHSPMVTESVSAAAASASTSPSTPSGANHSRGRKPSPAYRRHTSSSPQTHRWLDSTAILNTLQDRVSPIAHVPGTHWQVQFSHLFSYGASYYSYFWSRRWASRIHRQLFAGKDMSAWRGGGEDVREHVLRWGGGRDPWIGLERIPGVVRDGERGGGRVVGELSDLS